MIRSMTGYGRAETVFEDKKVAVESKSINHKNLESSIRIPSSLSSLETSIKKRVAEVISRGRVEVSIKIESASGGNGAESLGVNQPLLESYYALLKGLKETFNLAGDIRLETLVGIKGAVLMSETEIAAQEIWGAIEDALENSLISLIKMKEVEGELLYEDFTGRLKIISGQIAILKARVPEVLNAYQERLSARIRELTEGIECDESRLIQEVAIMAEKSDITEEIVRFESHIKQFGQMLQSDEPIGRKMDFLLQEMHREINTIGSKSSDLVISGAVIEVKTELAKLREQAQNIE